MHAGETRVWSDISSDLRRKFSKGEALDREKLRKLAVKYENIFKFTTIKIANGSRLHAINFASTEGMSNCADPVDGLGPSFAAEPVETDWFGS